LALGFIYQILSILIGPIVKLYNIRGDVGIPSNFLINQERKIIAKDIKTDELEFILNSQLNNLN